MLQQRLIFFALFVTVSYATTINFFDAQADVPFLGNSSTVFATHIQLWVDVTDCPSSSCSCQVQADVTGHDKYTLKFLNTTSNIGYVDIENLQPNTLYSFTLSCDGTLQTITRDIRTDYGRPSVPQNITVILNSGRLRISWLPPLVPAGPIHNYRLVIDQNLTINNLPNTELSYDMTEDYVYGTKQTFTVLACNEDRRNVSVCSSQDGNEVLFFLPLITTIPTLTTTIPSSTSIMSYPISFPFLVFIFFLFSQMKY